MKKTLLGILCPLQRTYTRILSPNFMLMLLIVSLNAFQLQASDTVGSISLNMESRPLKEVLLAIEAKTHYRFFYSTKLIDETKKVSVRLEDAPIGVVIAELFKNDPAITFKIKDDQIMLKKHRNEGSEKDAGVEESANENFTFFNAPVAPAMQEEFTISGRVTDETNTPLPGVSVYLKGTTIGTSTDAEGKYVLKLSDRTGTLVFSFIGYGTEEVVINDRTTLDMNLTPDLLSLSEIVVVGYGTVKKRDLTGSVASVKTTELVLTPTHNPIESMQGRVPGVDITRESGNPGVGTNIVIRGNRTISGAQTSPLYVVDGVQIPLGESISNLNANDIESIEILKDASATAIYGAMGSNGVVIVTTKKGVEGQTKVAYSGYFGINQYDFPEGRVGEDYMNLRREAYRSAGLWSSTADDVTIFSAGEWDAIQNNQWVNWVDLVKHDGRQQSHSVSVTGGTPKTKIFASGNYFREDGMLKDQDFSRYNVRLNLEHSINDWMKIGLLSQVNYSIQNKRLDPFSQALSLNPLGVPYDENGLINSRPLPYDQSKMSPLADERNEFIAKDNTISSGVLANGYIEITPVKGLTYRSNFGTNLSSSRNGLYYDKNSLNRAGNVSYAYSESVFSRSFNWDNVLTYTKEMGNHTISATGITSYIQSDQDKTTASGTNQVSPSQLYYGLSGSTVGAISSPFVGWKNMAYAGRLNYNFKGKYLVTLSGRYDGASRLSEGNKWAFFPSVALGWNISDEAFLSNVESISMLKLRASYGTAGNYSIKEYGTQSGIEANTKLAFGEIPAIAYLFKETIGNSELGWETTATTNLGLDIEVLNGKLLGTVDVYEAVTSDILMLRPLPMSSGVKQVYQNIGETRNRGVEVSITSKNVNTENFKWSTTVTFTSNKEEITKLIDGKDIIVNETESLLLGRPIKSFYSYERLGIWQSNESDLAQQYRPISATTPAYVPGDIKVADLNGDFIIDQTNDRQYVGSAVPKWVAGLQNNFTFHGFDLGVFLFARWGQTINAEYLSKYNPSGTGNASSDFDYWTPENATNDFPRPRKDQSWSSYTGYTGAGSLNFVDGSYFKIKNVTFGYTLPMHVVNNLSISRVRFYVTGSNLFVKAKSDLLENYDPERGGKDSSPLSKTFVFGVNVDF